MPEVEAAARAVPLPPKVVVTLIFIGAHGQPAMLVTREESARVTLAAITWTKLTVTFTPISGQVIAVFEPNFSNATKGTVLYWDDMSITAN